MRAKVSRRNDGAHVLQLSPIQPDYGEPIRICSVREPKVQPLIPSIGRRVQVLLLFLRAVARADQQACKLTCGTNAHLRGHRPPAPVSASVDGSIEQPGENVQEDVHDVDSYQRTVATFV